jgi:glucuronosyltransferase
LLHHPKVKLFITHCGGTSITESIYFGTPMLGFPVDGDQRSLCKKLQKFGIGKYGDVTQSPDGISSQI